MKTDELAKLNQMYREKSNPRENLRCSRSLEPDRPRGVAFGAGREEPKSISEDDPHGSPKPQHRLDVEMEDKLYVIGTTSPIRPPSRRVRGPGRKYHFRTYYKVLNPVTTEWKRSFTSTASTDATNGDHKTDGW